MDEHILKQTGKYLLILLIIQKALDTITKDNYHTLIKNLNNIINIPDSPHKPIANLKSSLLVLKELLTVQNEFKLAIYKYKIKQLNIQQEVDNTINYFVKYLYT